MLPASHRNRVGGTPRFMAPEVALAQVITNWEAIDVYGYGCIVHDCAHTNTDDGESFDSGAFPLRSTAVRAHTDSLPARRVSQRARTWTCSLPTR